MDRDPRSRRYDDGEVTRYGAGESYRPYNSNRSPRRARSPPLRDRPRSPPPDSDRYVPDRAPRRRSRSADRYRRDPSRDRRDLRDVRDVRDTGGDSWRRDDRSRTLRRSPPPPRRSPPRRSPLRRSPLRRFSPRRDDRDRLRSPRRGFDPRLNTLPQPDNPNSIPLTRLPYRRRSRSPLDRDRPRDRTPPRRSPPPLPRANTYRGRERSPDRRGDDRFGPTYARRPSPPRESAISSTLPSRDTSQRSSPRPDLTRRDDRSRPETPLPVRPISRSSHGGPSVREKTPQKTPQDTQSGPSRPSRSPPRGPAALRAPPTGPRDGRGYGGQSAGSIGPPARPAAAPAPSLAVGRTENGTGAPPSGPRGFVSGRGGSYGRGGRGGPAWGSTIQSRNLPTAPGPASASTTASSNSIPTGPRANTASQSVPSTPISQAKPFNPPKGPAAENNRPNLAQQLIASMPPLIPGGKMDSSHIPVTTGVLPELQSHMDRLKEEEEKLREEKYIKEEKLRKSLAAYEKGERETKVMALRTELAEQSFKKFAGEGLGGAAF
ncbi:hypothetical protein ANO14919_041770 [Xylariales sp. No.14919]|nr:hypothetical protein ANO14919_041770 [Xylariales sp. No.14919]